MFIIDNLNFFNIFKDFLIHIDLIHILIHFLIHIDHLGIKFFIIVFNLLFYNA